MNAEIRKIDKCVDQEGRSRMQEDQGMQGSEKTKHLQSVTTFYITFLDEEKSMIHVHIYFTVFLNSG